jgi:hypothetical protein
VNLASTQVDLQKYLIINANQCEYKKIDNSEGNKLPLKIWKILLIETSSRQRMEGGCLGGEIMTYLKALGILSSNQVVDEGWREKKRGGERHRKRSTNHLYISLGVTDIIARGVVTHLSKTSKYQEAQGPCLIHFHFLLY